MVSVIALLLDLKRDCSHDKSRTWLHAGGRGLPRKVSTQDENVKKKRRKRRSTEVVIDRILAAAGEEFERHGYAGATTSAIAKRARVAEPLIFNNFGTKSKLFRDSIFIPMSKHLLDFCTDHLPDVSDDASLERSREILSKQYVSELEAFVSKHSRKFISLFFAQMYEGKNGLDDVDGLQDYFEKAASLARGSRQELTEEDAQLKARISFAAIFSCIVFRDWLFPNGMLSSEQINAALTDFVISGVDYLPKVKE